MYRFLHFERVIGARKLPKSNANTTVRFYHAFSRPFSFVQMTVTRSHKSYDDD
ncbi:hypothetical protein NEOLEDRAFT_1144003 [Neolentinus lepideus HHB14362 ss-1]|uniref:Uncharacterized protein n=1 Tax=Neolentinus lepideus HHB14362 ss-1 TaxID=1314782 RepID=A0A165LTC1_9AGAM|nr:hypothetical protein NEOLEDRAFT_1144003 [Neolentinus lepideus HHB14362 ss-1]